MQLAIVVFAVTFCLACNNKGSPHRTKQFIPRFSIMDVTGRTVSSEDLEGSYVYIQFLKKRPGPDLMRIENMYKEILSQADCTSLFIIPDMVPGSAYQLIIRGTYLIIDKDSTLSLKLGAPTCCDSYYIYNRNRELMIQGIVNNDFQREVGPFVSELIQNRGLAQFDARFKVQKILESGLLADIQSRVSALGSASRYNFVGLINNVCNGCVSGYILDIADQCSKDSPNLLNPMLFVSEGFTEIDIANLITTLNVSIPIERVPSKIGQIWEGLRERFPSLFNNIFMIVDEYGDIKVCLDDREPEVFIEQVKRFCR